MPSLRLRARLAAVAFSLALPSSLAAQSACPTVAFPATLDGPRLFGGAAAAGVLRWESELPAWRCDDGSLPPTEPGLFWRPAALRAGYRSGWALDRNNGSVWDGKGGTLSVLAGGRFLASHLRVTLAPKIAFQQNGDFVIARVFPGGNPVGYPYPGLDWPQRFGENAFWTLDLGDSRVAATWRAAGIALGVDNVWWGPTRRYPLLFGNSGPGFPHAEIGLSRPVWIGFGDLRATLLFGRLDESDYFDAASGDDLRLLTAVFVELQPMIFPGFTIGLSGVQHNLWSEKGRLLFDLFAFPFTTKESSEGNGLLSLTAEWTDSEGDFAVYSEWARDDFWLNTEDLLTEPDHAQAYAIGFENRYRRPEKSVRFTFELAHLGSAAPAQTGRSYARIEFYTHFLLSQGHSHRGQLLGAWIGPGSDAQYLAVDLEGDRRVVGAYAERVRHNEDKYYELYGAQYGFRGHDLEWTLGLQGLERVGALDIDWQGGLSRRKNRGFIGLDGANWDFRRETNLEATVTAWWLPGR